MPERLSHPSNRSLVPGRSCFKISRRIIGPYTIDLFDEPALPLVVLSYLPWPLQWREVQNKVISSFQARRHARAPVAGFKPATEGCLSVRYKENCLMLQLNLRTDTRYELMPNTRLIETKESYKTEASLTQLTRLAAVSLLLISGFSTALGCELVGNACDGKKLPYSFESELAHHWATNIHSPTAQLVKNDKHTSTYVMKPIQTSEKSSSETLQPTDTGRNWISGGLHRTASIGRCKRKTQKASF
ncbi:hypothetical protein PoB_000776100 [Plakobranchus ocellatus]|uniref:Uncharacterized protein n=1 Tax=Plakobranchus ocellatus TaxID=259542 RepID=A0AAV3YDK3_9GAST|nr:hypothetical protein PoB_000776100 [Plakobranchus ocellatus]